MLIWPEDFCTALAGRGFQVARFDNRDTGLSTHLTGAPAPGWLKAMLRPSAAPYRLEDMAADVLAVMGALGWRSAHVVGASLGGMIAQALAIRHPARVRTLTSIMSTPSARIATMPTVAAMRALARAAGTPVTRPDQAGEEAVALKRVIGSPGYPLDEAAVRDIGRRSFERHPGAEQDDRRQRAAVIASGDRRNALASTACPRAGPARGAGSGDPAQGRAGNSGRHPGRQTRHLPRHGPRPAQSTMAVDPGRDPGPGRTNPHNGHGRAACLAKDGPGAAWRPWRSTAALFTSRPAAALPGCTPAGAAATVTSPEHGQHTGQGSRMAGQQPAGDDGRHGNFGRRR